MLANELVARLKSVDIVIDQGGCFADSRPTTHDEPVHIFQRDPPLRRGLATRGWEAALPAGLVGEADADWMEATAELRSVISTSRRAEPGPRHGDRGTYRDLHTAFLTTA